ncbi:MAG: trigger factor [bacterium]|nr:MAG: trigger factor [bacterium]
MAQESSNLKIAVEEPRAWARRLTITVPAERVERARGEVARRLAQRLKLPGFRKGKVPTHVVERRYGPAIDSETVERVVGDAYREALQVQGLEPITQGSVEEVDYRPGADLTFRVAFEIKPQIQLERLGGFRLVRPRPEIRDEDVDRVIERLRMEHAVWRPVEDAAPVDGDAVEVELTELDRPEPKPERYRLVLGQGQAVPEVEALIRGLKPGEEVEGAVPVTRDGETREEAVRVRLLAVRRPELPALDDAWARSVGDFEDLAALRARIREDLQRDADAAAERELRRELIDRIIEANPFEVPDAMVEQYLDGILRPREGVDPQQLAELRQAARPAAEQAIRRTLVVDRVAKMEGLEATPAEVDARVEEIASRVGRPVEEVRREFVRSGRLEALADEITEEKVFEYLKSLSTVE